MPERLSDAELRHRLEEHSYNVPPITDTTRSVLIKKLRQLDSEQQRHSKYRRQDDSKQRHQARPGIDYSSAEEDFLPPVSSTKKNGGRTRPSASSGTRNGDHQPAFRQRESTSTIFKLTGGRSSFKPSGGRSSRSPGSLLQQSEEEEDEEDSEELEEEEEDEEEDSDERFDDYEDEVTVPKADLAVQTSFTTPEPETRFRGKTVTPTSGSQPYSIKSPHLRQKLHEMGSLNEALSTMPAGGSTLPAASKPQMAGRPIPSLPSSPVSQVPRSAVRHNFSRSETSRNSMWAPSIIAFLIALFFLIVFYKYLNLAANPQEKIPICLGSGVDKPNLNCIPGEELNLTVELLQRILTLVKEDQSCLELENRHSVPRLMEQLVQSSQEQMSLPWERLLSNVLLLLRENPVWGVHPVQDDGGDVTHLALREGSGGLLCWLQFIVFSVVELLLRTTNYILAVGSLGVLAWVLWRLWSWRREARDREQQDMFGLVGQVLNLLHENHLKKGEVQTSSYIAIDHIRDDIISPQDRSRKRSVWRRAVDYIRNHESRVREEIQHIHGEEFRVWRWLPDIPLSPTNSFPPTPAFRGPPPAGSGSRSPGITVTSVPRPVMRPDPPAANTPEAWPFVSTSSAGSPAGWQGSAFQLNRHVSSPVEPPTSCLKVRNMFDLPNVEADWINSLKRDIVSRCREARILHIAVDRESKEGVVYIKTMSTEDAGRVFKNLHGQWYKNQLVTAKYLRMDRYHQRFPDSVNVKKPMMQ